MSKECIVMSKFLDQEFVNIFEQNLYYTIAYGPVRKDTRIIFYYLSNGVFKPINFIENNVNVTGFGRSDTYKTESKKGPGAGSTFKVGHGKLTFVDRGDILSPAYFQANNLQPTPADIKLYCRARLALSLLKVILTDAVHVPFKFAGSEMTLFLSSRFGLEFKYKFQNYRATNSNGDLPPPFSRLLNHPNNAAICPPQLKNKGLYTNEGVGLQEFSILADAIASKLTPGDIMSAYKKKSSTATTAYFTEYLPFVDFRKDDGTTPQAHTALISIDARNVQHILSKSLVTTSREDPKESIKTGPHGQRKILLYRPWDILGSSNPTVRPLTAIGDIFFGAEIYIGSQKCLRFPVELFTLKDWKEERQLDLPDQVYGDDEMVETYD